MTECTQNSFEFQAHFSRAVRAEFDGGTMTSDAGGVLLRETDRRLQLLPRLAQCFLDGRDPARIEHSVAEMVAQRAGGEHAANAIWSDGGHTRVRKPRAG